MGRNKNDLKRLIALLLILTIVMTGMPGHVEAKEKTYFTYTINDGDTMKKIAGKFNTEIVQIKKLNRFENSYCIYAGKTIKIPVVSCVITYVVKKGDTLNKIAKVYGTTAAKIGKENGLYKLNQIKAGQKLNITVKNSVLNKSTAEVKETVVSTQKGLLNALKSDQVQVIRISTAKNMTFEIPENDYKKKDLIVDAKNSDVINHGTFHQIRIEAIKQSTFHEFGQKNVIVVKASDAHIVIDKSAVIKKLILEDTNQSIQIDNYSSKQVNPQAGNKSFKLEAGKTVEITAGKVAEKKAIKNNENPSPETSDVPSHTPDNKTEQTPAEEQKPTETQESKPVEYSFPWSGQNSKPSGSGRPGSTRPSTPPENPTPAPQVPSDVVDFSTWNLQLPLAGPSGTSILQIKPAELNAGYEHPEYFYLDTDGGIVFDCPVVGFKTANTSYTRTELREIVTFKGHSDWPWEGTHILRTSEAVTRVPSSGKTMVNQIHGIYPDGTNGPVLLKVQYEASATSKDIVVYFKENIKAGSDRKEYFRDVPFGQRFDTEVKCIDGVLYVTISSGDRSETYTFDFLEADPEWYTQLFYYKVGNYVQDSVEDYPGEGATVKVYSVETEHTEEVANVPIQALSVKPESVILGTGETMQLNTAFTPADTSNKAVEWRVISGQDKVAVSKKGVITGIAEGSAVVRVTSAENSNVYAECNVSVVAGSQQQVVTLYEQNFGDDVPFDIANAPEWTTATSEGLDNLAVEVVNENGNYVLKHSDRQASGSAKSILNFGEQSGTTTITFKIRYDEVLGKDLTTSKPKNSCSYLDIGGSAYNAETGFMSANDVMFRIKNAGTAQGDQVIGNHFQFTSSYKDAEMNSAAADFNIGDWKEVTLVITPKNGTAGANKTDVYVDGYQVMSQLENNYKDSEIVGLIQFATGTADQVSFSIDDVKVYSGVNVMESDDLQAPTAITIGMTPDVIAVGDYFQITPTIEPIGAKTAVTYSIIDGREAVVVSKNGLVTAIAPGNATIRVSSSADESVYAECSVNVCSVNDMVRVESLSLSKSTYNLLVEESDVIIPVLTPSNATEQKVSYDIKSGFDVVSVTDQGVITALKTGTATICVTSVNNEKAFVECTIVVSNHSTPGTVVFSDDFSAAQLDVTKWTLATSNVGNTTTKVENGALHLTDNNVSGQPRANITFEPQASTFTIEFKVKMSKDTIYDTTKVSAFCAAFGSGAITSTANEAFRFKTGASVTEGEVTNRQFIYSKEANETGFYNTEVPYELDQWYSICLVTTPNDGSDKANTTDIYIDGNLVQAGAGNKTTPATMDKLIFQTASGDLTEYWIDDVVVTVGDVTKLAGPQLMISEDFEATLSTAAPNPYWKLTTDVDCISEAAEVLTGNHALKIFDGSASKQPKAQFFFDKITSKATIEFKLRIDSDENRASDGNFSEFCFVFGSSDDGEITSNKNEMFRLKSAAVSGSAIAASGSAINRFFKYQDKDSWTSMDNTTNYELYEFTDIKLVITMGENGTTDVYVDGQMVGSGFNKKTTDNIDSILFQTGTNELTKFWIDDLKVYSGHKLD